MKPYMEFSVDKLMPLKSGDFRFDGPLMDTMKFVSHAQLLNSSLWKRFVDQFRQTPDDDHAWRCEYWGKMMRGGSLVYACTQEEELYDVLVSTVRDLLTTQDEEGRIATYSKEVEFHGWDLWGRKYVLLGLQYFLDICKDMKLRSEIIEAMKRHADYIIIHIGGDEGQTEINLATDHWGGLNSSSILEPFVKLYNLTKEIRYLEFADYIVSRGGCTEMNIFEMAYEGRLYPYQYTFTKAYEMMSCFEGLLEYYRVTGVEKWRVAVENFARLIAASDITLIGCSGCTHELFDHSAVRQLDVTEEGVIQETCVAVTWMKLCYQLLRLTGDPFYAEHIEQSLYNALMGAVNIEKVTTSINLIENIVENTAEYTGGYGFPFDSYSPILPGSRGRSTGGMQPMLGGGYYGCCACIGAAGLGIPGISAVMRKLDGYAVNQYLNGQFTADKDVELDITTKYPVEGEITVRVKTENPEQFALYLRIPAWSKRSTVTVNANPVERVLPGSYVRIERVWNSGDVVALALDMTITRAMPEEYGVSSQDAAFVTFRRGPLVLCRDARLGQSVDDAITLAQQDNFIRDDGLTFPHLTAWKLDTVNGPVRLVDYASAGKTWTEESRIAAWIPVTFA